MGLLQLAVEELAEEELAVEAAVAEEAFEVSGAAVQLAEGIDGGHFAVVLLNHFQWVGQPGMAGLMLNNPYCLLLEECNLIPDNFRGL